MVDRIGDGGLAREAILAAMKSQAQKAADLRAVAGSLGRTLDGVGAGQEAEPAADFADKLRDGIRSVDDEIKRVDDLPRALLEGQVEDLHEVAAQIKKAEFTFRFAMEIRDKLIDSYREVMRMNV